MTARILVVDDVPANVKLLEARLSAEYFDVVTAYCGADALAVINTITGIAVDAEKRVPVLGNVRGGLSGPAIKPIALLKVHQVYEVAGPLGVPIIGQGGITTVTDALEFIIAGATAVGIGTALFYDPLVLKTINAGIADYLARHGMTSAADLIGTLQLP